MNESLDPKDWNEFRKLGHQMLDDIIDFVSSVNERPAWQGVPETVAENLNEPVPKDGTSLEDVYEKFTENVLPYPTGNIHPRFFGWVMGNGTPEGMLADMLASGMNPHAGGYDQSAAIVEQQVIDWFIELLGYPEQGGGLLVSGGTMANLIGVAVARNDRRDSVRELGLADGKQLTLYGSTETHSWLEKACDLLGLGRAAVRRLEADEDGKLDLEALKKKVRGDRSSGYEPLCVVGNAGTVDSGAVDDLSGIADFCENESLWFHVDGAFGALLALTENYGDRLSGIERSDSIAFDLHKWGYIQYEVGGVITRDRTKQRAAFETSASYLASPGGGIQPGPLKFSELGPQLSRGFRALKVWMSLKHHGTKKVGRIIEQNVNQAQHLVRLIEKTRELELMGPAPLNIVCFRYRPNGVDDESELEALNKKILVEIQERGIAVPSSTMREGRYSLRVAITNHRTRLEDIDLLVNEILKIGEGRLTA